MAPRVLCLGLLFLLCGCGESEPSPKPAAASFDGTVTFFIAPDKGPKRPGTLAETTVAFLAVEKAGRTRFVDAWQDGAPEGSRYGRHRFPAGTTAAAVAAYYSMALEVAGWKSPEDFMASDGSIHFFGATSLRAGSDRSELWVTSTP